MKKTFITTSILTLLISSVFAQDYLYDANGVYTDSRGFTIFENMTVENLDYSKKTYYVDGKIYENNTPSDYEHHALNGALTVIDSTIKNMNFSVSTFKVETPDYKKLNNLTISSKNNISIIENVVVSNSNFTFTDTVLQNTEDTPQIYLNAVLKNVSFANSMISSNSNSTGISIEGFAKDINFQNVTIINNNSTYAVKLSLVNNLTYENLAFESSNIDFRGATVNGNNLSINDINSIGEVKNLLDGNGEIHSYAEGDTTTNLGLVLNAGETFTIAKYEPKDGSTTFSLSDSGISAKLTTNSTINGGTIIFEDGETLQLSDGVKLEVSGDTVIDNGTIIFGENASITVSENSELVIADGTEFVLSEGVTVDSVLSTETGSTIVMAGYETDEEAQQAFGNMFVDESGKVVTFDTSNYNVIGGTAIPEPSTYAVIFGSLALGFVAYCRRK